jgi:2'-5' RNA ligase
MKLVNIFTEGIDRKHEYGCVMLYFDFPEIDAIHELIEPNDVYHDDNDDSFGLEKKPHTTLLYGLHEEVPTEDVEDVLSNFTYGNCTINNTSLFEGNPKYDVLKFDVSGPSLHETNHLLREFPHTNNFPNYHPHLTIGYIKSGEGKKYTEKFNGLQFKLSPKYAVYSKTNGDEDLIKINVN